MPDQPFRPTTIDEYFALRIAEKLNDVPHVTNYIPLFDRYGLDAMFSAYQRARAGRHRKGSLVERFVAELAREVKA